MQSAETQQNTNLPTTIDPWTGFNRALPDELMEPLGGYLATLGLSFDSALMAAWCHLMSAYSTAESLTFSILQEPSPCHRLMMLHVPISVDRTVRDLLGRIMNALTSKTEPDRTTVEVANSQPVFANALLLRNQAFGCELGSLAKQHGISLILQANGPTERKSQQRGESATSIFMAFDRTRIGLETAEMLVDCLISILRELPLYDDKHLSEMPFISREALLKYSGPIHDIGKMDTTICIHHQIEHWSHQNPERRCAVSDQGQMNFGELNRRANQLARYLRSRDCGRETVVAVHLDRSMDLLVTLLAVLKAGAAFLPLDATLPEGRVQNVIEDSRAPLIITRSHLANRFERWQKRVICLDSDNSNWQGEADTNFSSLACPEDLAYVTYTSGSTGTPKGVMIEHRNLAAFSKANDEVLGSTPGVFLATTNISFDIAVVELLWSLSRGFTVILCAGDEGLPLISGPGSISAQILEHGVTHVQGTPTLFRLMLTDSSASEALQKVRKVVIGGEPFPPALAAALLTIVSGDIINGYGPTETTIVSTFHVVRKSQAPIPIGKPLLNTLYYVLDKRGRPLPPLAPGELYLGGASVARGYLHRPDLTAERFTQDGSNTGQQNRVYRTGDLVRLRFDGDLEFIGRVDLQVKIGGYRIELGEIESVIETFPNVRSSAVVVREEPSGEKRLAGYYSDAGPDPVQPAALRKYLEHVLPSYMVPRVLHRLDVFPLTSNGKVDRVKLAQLEGRQVEICGGADGKQQTDPRLKATEDVLCSWCCSLLKISTVDPLDDFFQIGGESVIAAQLAQQIVKHFGKNLKLSEFFKARTMRSLARLVCQIDDQHQSWSPAIKIRKGTKVPLFLISGLGGNAVNFELLCRFLPDRPTYAVETFGLDQNGQQLLSMEDMARCYLRAMRDAEPEGPYHLMGYSFGGTLAFEMAQQLRAAGEEVGILGLLDTSEWGYWQREVAALTLRERLNLRYGATLKQLTFGPDRRKTLRQRVTATFEHHMISIHARLGLKTSVPAASIEHRNYYALTKYIPKPYDGEIQLFRCNGQQRLRTDPTLGWGQLCQRVESSDLPAEHERIFAVPAALERLGSRIGSLLDQKDLASEDRWCRN